MKLPSCSLKDVGRQAGVSIATASMALRSDPRISEATQERVRQAARQLGYQPDPVLAALVARRDRVRPRRSLANIAALLDDRWGADNRPWLERMFAGIRQACQRLGYAMEVLRIRQDLGSAPDRILHARGMRGVILLPLVDDHFPVNLSWERYVVVVVGNSFLSRRMHRVGNDAFGAMNLVCERIAALGYRRPGLAHPKGSGLRLRYEWLGGLSKELFLDSRGLRMVPPHLPEAMGPGPFVDWVRQTKPDCVITDNSQTYDWMGKAAYKIPKDIGLALLTQNTGERAGFSGVAPHLGVAGESAVEQLHASLLRGETGFPDNPKEILIQPHWVEGQTLRQQDPIKPTRRKPSSPASPPR